MLHFASLDGLQVYGSVDTVVDVNQSYVALLAVPQKWGFHMPPFRFLFI